MCNDWITTSIRSAVKLTVDYLMLLVWNFLDGTTNDRARSRPAIIGRVETIHTEHTDHIYISKITFRARLIISKRPNYADTHCVVERSTRAVFTVAEKREGKGVARLSIGQDIWICWVNIWQSACMYHGKHSHTASREAKNVCFFFFVSFSLDQLLANRCECKTKRENANQPWRW